LDHLVESLSAGKVTNVARIAAPDSTDDLGTCKVGRQWSRAQSDPPSGVKAEDMADSDIVTHHSLYSPVLFTTNRNAGDLGDKCFLLPTGTQLRFSLNQDRKEICLRLTNGIHVTTNLPMEFLSDLADVTQLQISKLKILELFGRVVHI